MEKLLYKERLKGVGPLSVERRRPRGKWAMVYNISKAVSQVDPEPNFTNTSLRDASSFGTDWPIIVRCYFIWIEMILYAADLLRCNAKGGRQYQQVPKRSRRFVDTSPVSNKRRKQGYVMDGL